MYFCHTVQHVVTFKRKQIKRGRPCGRKCFWGQRLTFCCSAEEEWCDDCVSSMLIIQTLFIQFDHLNVIFLPPYSVHPWTLSFRHVHRFGQFEAVATSLCALHYRWENTRPPAGIPSLWLDARHRSAVDFKQLEGAVQQHGGTDGFTLACW